MKNYLALFLLSFMIIGVSGCSAEKSKSEQIISEYLKKNYSSYSFDLAVTDGDPKGITYWATEKNHPNISSYIAYYPDTGDIKENIPVALIHNEFEQYFIEKIKKAFPDSKVYWVRENSIDDWNHWESYEYSLENYLDYLSQNDVSGKTFTVVLDSNSYNMKMNQLNSFYTDIEKYHYISLRLFYVPKNYVDEADHYFKDSGFEWDTPFYKSHVYDEFIYVYGGQGERYLHSSKDGDLKP